MVQWKVECIHKRYQKKEKHVCFSDLLKEDFLNFIISPVKNVRVFFKRFAVPGI